MQVGGVSLDLTLFMHEQAFGDYLTDHSFLSLESVAWRTGYTTPENSESWRSKGAGKVSQHFLPCSPVIT